MAIVAFTFPIDHPVRPTLVGISDWGRMEIVKLESGAVVERVAFPRGCGATRAVHQPGGAGLLFMGVLRSLRGGDRLVLYDRSGEVVATHRADDYITGTAAGDVDADGKTEFYVSAASKIVKLNADGKVMASRELKRTVTVIGTCPRVGKRPSGLSVLLGSRTILLLDGGLRAVHRARASRPLAEVKECDWPTPGHILAYAGASIFVLDLDGKVVLRHRMGWPKLHVLFGAEAVAVKLRRKRKPYLAVIGQLRASANRSILCIIGPDGRLVHRETIRDSSGLLAVPESSGAQSLLAPDGFEVYKYTAQ